MPAIRITENTVIILREMLRYPFHEHAGPGIAERLGMTSQLVRENLTRLVPEGWVTCRQAERHVTMPPLMWKLTAKGRKAAAEEIAGWTFTDR